MHHRLKRGQGGLWEPQNIVALCGDGVRGCHGWCEANPRAGHEIGFCVKPWEDPAEMPILYRLSQWALLLPNGEVIEYDTAG
jgi:hypothetical protein